MRKSYPILIALFSLVFISLFTYIPLRNSSNSFLYNTSAKSVNLNSKNHFINKLSNFIYAAHRGAPMISNEPENSLTTFKASRKLGFRIVETDLQLTKDSKWVIMHDNTLDRTTTGKGLVKTYTLNDIERFKLKENKNENLSIPTLDDFLKLCKNEELMPILDIKPNDSQITPEIYNSLLDSMRKYNLLDKSIFCSYSKEVLTELRRRDDLTTIAVMMNPTQDNLNFVKKISNAFIYCNYKSLTDENISLININNISFGVYTVNDETIAKHFLEEGAFVVVTDKLLKNL